MNGAGSPFGRLDREQKPTLQLVAWPQESCSTPFNLRRGAIACPQADPERSHSAMMRSHGTVAARHIQILKRGLRSICFNCPLVGLKLEVGNLDYVAVPGQEPELPFHKIAILIAPIVDRNGFSAADELLLDAVRRYIDA